MRRLKGKFRLFDEIFSPDADWFENIGASMVLPPSRYNNLSSLFQRKSKNFFYKKLLSSWFIL